LADAILIGVSRWLDFHEVARPDRWPRLESIRRRLEGDPAVQFALSIEGGESPEGTGACQGHVNLGEVIHKCG
jgi:glutathione S-transferase